MLVRRYLPGEESEIWDIYFNTTHEIVAREYTVDQINRWVPRNMDMTWWAERLAQTNPFVAVEDGHIVGFAELEPNGHIDYFYCHHKRQRQGIGTSLLDAVEQDASSLGLKSIYAEVSTTAIDFFKAKGFEVEEEKTNPVCGAPAKQCIVRKLLGE